MYPNLRAEMARKNVTVEMLAKAMGVNASTVSAKLNTDNRIKYCECCKVRDKYFCGMQLDYLFASEPTQAPAGDGRAG